MVHIPAEFLQHGVLPASQQLPGQRLSCGNAALDAFFGGGLPIGAVTECGMPLGRGGRNLLLPYLRAASRGSAEGHATNALSLQHDWWVLWVTRDDELQPLPVSWLARGIKAERLVFAATQEPLQDLQRVFIRPFFQMIVLDRPARLTRDDCAFLSRQARQQNLTVVLVRDYFLSHTRGNVWAQMRVNAWIRQDVLVAKTLRGGEEQCLSLPLKNLP